MEVMCYMGNISSTAVFVVLGLNKAHDSVCINKPILIQVSIRNYLTENCPNI